MLRCGGGPSEIGTFSRRARSTGPNTFASHLHHMCVRRICKPYELPHRPAPGWLCPPPPTPHPLTPKSGGGPSDSEQLPSGQSTGPFTFASHLHHMRAFIGLPHPASDCPRGPPHTATHLMPPPAPHALAPRRGRVPCGCYAKRAGHFTITSHICITFVIGLPHPAGWFLRPCTHPSPASGRQRPD